MIDWLRKDRSKSGPVLEAAVEIAIAGRALPLAIRRHASARRLTMRLAPDGSELRVTMPRWGQSRDALAFADARREWIAAQLAKVPELRRIVPGAKLPYRGREITIAWGVNAPRMPHLVGDALVVGGPVEALEARVRRWLESEALELAAEDLAHYCQRAQVPLPDLRLSRAQRRWGSCSGKANGPSCVRINWRLVMAPDLIRRSVVAHEVAHLTHFDHSPQFHALLATLFDDDLPAADLWLKEHGRSLYAICP